VLDFFRFKEEASCLGMQVGRVTGADTIELLYQCLTLEGELLAGWSRGGESSYVEIVT